MAFLIGNDYESRTAYPPVWRHRVRSFHGPLTQLANRKPLAAERKTKNPLSNLRNKIEKRQFLAISPTRKIISR